MGSYKISFGDNNKRRLIQLLFSINGEGDKEQKLPELINLAKKAKVLDTMGIDDASIGGNVDPIGGLEDARIKEFVDLALGLVKEIKGSMPMELEKNFELVVSSGLTMEVDEEQKLQFEKLRPFGIQIEDEGIKKDKEAERGSKLEQSKPGAPLSKPGEENDVLDEKSDTPDEKTMEKLFSPTKQDKEEDSKILATIPEKEKEYYLKKYYLSGEKMYESIKKTAVFNTLPSNMQNKIKDAYLSCSQPSDLEDPDYLNKRLGSAFGLKDKMQGFEALHMAALGNTYVGYHMEEVGSVSAGDPGESKDIAMLQFPAFAEEMPESIKEEVRRRGKEYIENRIRDVLNGNDSITALAILSPFDDFLDSSLDNLESQLGSGKDATSMKLYLKEMQKDVKGNVQGNMKNFDVAINASDVNFQDREQALAFIERMRNLDKEAGELNIDNAIKVIASEFQINSMDDARKVVAIRGTLEKVCPNVDFDLIFGNIPEEQRAEINEYLSSHGFADEVAQETISDVVEEMMVGDDTTALGSVRRGGRLARDVAFIAGGTAAVVGASAMGIASPDILMSTAAMAAPIAGPVPGGLAAVAGILYANGSLNTSLPNYKELVLSMLGCEADVAFEDIEQELMEAMMDITDELGIPGHRREDNN